MNERFKEFIVQNIKFIGIIIVLITIAFCMFTLSRGSGGSSFGGIGRSSMFDKIPLDEEGQMIVDMENGNYTEEKVKKNGKVVIEKVPKLTEVQKRERLAKNRRLILAECLRREPKMHKYNTLELEPSPVPPIDYVEEVLIEKVGYEYLYSDVTRGVKLIMDYVSDARKDIKGD